MPGFFQTSHCFVRMVPHKLLAPWHYVYRATENNMFGFSLAPGTYCQQREVEAITEGVEDDDGECFSSLPWNL